jgi:hypothetical protein
MNENKEFKNLKDEFELIPTDEWDKPTAYYFLGQTDQSYATGQIAEHEWKLLRERIPLSAEEKQKVWWLS